MGEDFPYFDVGDGPLDDVPDLAQGCVGLFLGFGEFAFGGFLVGGGGAGSDVALVRDAARGADFFQDAGGGNGLGVVDGAGQRGPRPIAGAR